MSIVRPPSPEFLAWVRAEEERRLSPEEFDARAGVPMTDWEREDFHALMDWFCRRYPTPLDRLAWARRAYATWMKSVPK